MTTMDQKTLDSCVAACNDRETSQPRFQACANRCSIQFCQDIPMACKAWRPERLQQRLQLLQ